MIDKINGHSTEGQLATEAAVNKVAQAFDSWLADQAIVSNISLSFLAVIIIERCVAISYISDSDWADLQNGIELAIQSGMDNAADYLDRVAKT